jgi:hypothetical protein
MPVAGAVHSINNGHLAGFEFFKGRDLRHRMDHAHRRSGAVMGSVVRLYGKRESPQAYALRDYLQRSDIPLGGTQRQ